MHGNVERVEVHEALDKFIRNVARRCALRCTSMHIRELALFIGDLSGNEHVGIRGARVYFRETFD